MSAGAPSVSSPTSDRHRSPSKSPHRPKQSAKPCPRIPTIISKRDPSRQSLLNPSHVSLAPHSTVRILKAVSPPERRKDSNDIKRSTRRVTDTVISYPDLDPDTSDYDDVFKTRLRVIDDRQMSHSSSLASLNSMPNLSPIQQRKSSNQHTPFTAKSLTRRDPATIPSSKSNGNTVVSLLRPHPIQAWNPNSTSSSLKPKIQSKPPLRNTNSDGPYPHDAIAGISRETTTLDSSYQLTALPWTTATANNRSVVNIPRTADVTGDSTSLMDYLDVSIIDANGLALENVLDELTFDGSLYSENLTTVSASKPQEVAMRIEDLSNSLRPEVSTSSTSNDTVATAGVTTKATPSMNSPMLVLNDTHHVTVIPPVLASKTTSTMLPELNTQQTQTPSSPFIADDPSIVTRQQQQIEKLTTQLSALTRQVLTLRRTFKQIILYQIKQCEPAAIKLQAVIRGFLIRKRLRDQKVFSWHRIPLTKRRRAIYYDKMALIEECSRISFAGDSVLSTSLDDNGAIAAVKIQSWFRAVMVRIRINEYTAFYKAAVRIQASWRGYQIRKCNPNFQIALLRRLTSRHAKLNRELQAEVLITQQNLVNEVHERIVGEKILRRLYEEVETLRKWRSDFEKDREASKSKLTELNRIIHELQGRDRVFNGEIHNPIDSTAILSPRAGLGSELEDDINDSL
ncbi:hypothetical protein SeMB42_g00202 [Synchytrium endobioticum]|uniref:Uncharacterized protein n=1 Tax=Synchytrium endobioticum TaxID=286115 RepID=A0A507DTK3_9FUNG|nr:hypothetical protein SeLEV6574_g02400 [Synchytrium endobioticum]TPX54555.1 hypothetical protein SeMB42_g00202 [Synchytrium endobioticum]